jgi:putative tryptophan/tyrosine transport system substrate-binding protein
MRRRELVTLLGGAGGVAVRGTAQQGERMQRIGVLMSVAADGPEGQRR